MAMTSKQKSSQQMRVLGERFISFLNPPRSFIKCALVGVSLLLAQCSYADHSVKHNNEVRNEKRLQASQKGLCDDYTSLLDFDRCYSAVLAYESGKARNGEVLTERDIKCLRWWVKQRPTGAVPCVGITDTSTSNIDGAPSHIFSDKGKIQYKEARKRSIRENAEYHKWYKDRGYRRLSVYEVVSGKFKRDAGIGYTTLPLHLILNIVKSNKGKKDCAVFIGGHKGTFKCDTLKVNSALHRHSQIVDIEKWKRNEEISEELRRTMGLK